MLSTSDIESAPNTPSTPTATKQMQATRHHSPQTAMAGRSSSPGSNEQPQGARGASVPCKAYAVEGACLMQRHRVCTRQEERIKVLQGGDADCGWQAAGGRRSRCKDPEMISRSDTRHVKQKNTEHRAQSLRQEEPHFLPRPRRPCTSPTTSPPPPKSNTIAPANSIPAPPPARKVTPAHIIAQRPISARRPTGAACPRAARPHLTSPDLTSRRPTTTVRNGYIRTAPVQTLAVRLRQGRARLMRIYRRVVRASQRASEEGREGKEGVATI
ncbi:hypothetical protein SVAN01_02557 [Stagonosporopsis vannaccii]|nr:hypothetical protein SVAN01_02557 [Stagonosporopsis vannaccii]